MLWDTMPDNTLTINADQNKLSNPSEVSSQVDRMLQDSRAKQMTANYILQYFGLENVPHLEKDGSMFPEFNDNLKKYLTAETIAFANHVIWHGTGSFKELLTANYSFINEPLGAIYGVDGLRGSTLVKTNLNSTQRSGILTQSSFLASLGHPTYGSPTFRGVFIKERLLCQPVPQPPPDVADDITAPSAFITTRERYEVHTRKTSCMECHQRMDPIGFTFEKYDSLGKFRTVENGKVVNSSATVRLTGDTDASYEDAIGLIQSLSKSPQVSDCAATNYFRYSLGRLETPSDACELNSIREKFSTSNQNILQLIRDVVSSHAFFYRRKE